MSTQTLERPAAQLVLELTEKERGQLERCEAEELFGKRSCPNCGGKGVHEFRVTGEMEVKRETCELCAGSGTLLEKAA